MKVKVFQKALASLLAVGMLTGLAACSQPAPSGSDTSAPTVSGQTGGTYTGTARGFGGDVTVTITVADGKMTDITAAGDQETPDIGQKAVAELPAKMLEAQTYDVDVISGATISSNAVKDAAKAAMT